MGFNEVTFEASSYLTDQLITSDLPEVVFSGRSNVGKSSMINKLANRKKLARVSSAPGKTASVNFYRCGAFRFVDLPGYGFAKVSHEEKEKWAELVEGYLAQARRIALVIQLVDARHGPTQDDADMLAFLKSYDTPFIVAQTKCDKLNKTEFAARRAAASAEVNLPDDKIIFFSSETGEGVDALEKLIKKSIEEMS
jgi:GTP-binding protein